MSTSLKFISKVALPVDTVVKKFDRKLFESLFPPFSLINLLQYDGTHSGGIYKLGTKYLNMPVWMAEITEAAYVSPKEYVFVDEVTHNKAGIVSWRHVHRFIEGPSRQTYIVDEVEFSAKNKLLEKTFEVALRTYFLYRQLMYKKLLSA